MDLYNHPKLKEAFDIYVREQDAQLPDEEFLSTVTFSPAFHQRMEQLFALRQKGYFVLFGTAGRRIATIVVTLLVAATITTVSVEALRTPVVQFFAEVFEKFTQIFVIDDTADAPEEMSFEPHAPTYIPEGYVVVEEENLPTMYRIVYQDNTTDLTICCTQRRKGSYYLTMDTEDIEYTEIKIGKHNGVVYSNKTKTFLVFMDEKYTYILSASLSTEELIKIAESIKNFE